VSDRLGGPGRRAGPPPEPRAADQQLRAQANAQASSRGRRPPRLQRPRLPGAPLSALSGARRARCRSRLGHRGSHVDAGLGAVDGGAAGVPLGCASGASAGARVDAGLGGRGRGAAGAASAPASTGLEWMRRPAAAAAHTRGSCMPTSALQRPRLPCTLTAAAAARVHADLRGSSVHDFRARRPVAAAARPRGSCTPTSAVPASTTWINSGGSWIPPPRGLLRMREEKFDNVDRARHSRTKKNLTARVQYASDTA
jgi:hypothetical protein